MIAFGISFAWLAIGMLIFMVYTNQLVHFPDSKPRGGYWTITAQALVWPVLLIVGVCAIFALFLHALLRGR